MNKQNLPIKALFSDIDGTLTDGQLYYDAKGESIKVFNVKDGAAIKYWMGKGLYFGVISARSSEIINTRMKELGVTDIFTGSKDKHKALEEWLESKNLSWENLAYIGDDKNDISAMQSAIVSAAPADADSEVLQLVEYRCTLPGGRGAVREFIDFLLDNFIAESF
jgi:3-deoxy-D-manno-octulosonate 8-phosphate phosphatase (KDO 8-P phosphatase)